MLQTKKTTIDVIDGKTLLEMLLTEMGHDHQFIKPAALQDIAIRLSHMAGKDKPWTWRYLRNILNQKLEPSARLVDAIQRMGAVEDGLAVDIASANRIYVMAAGHIHPGSLILADSRICANPECSIWFVPRTPNQKYHAASCRRKVK